MMVKGDLSVNSENIECTTVPILQVGYHTLHISEDGGSSFPIQRTDLHCW